MKLGIALDDRVAVAGADVRGNAVIETDDVVHPEAVYTNLVWRARRLDARREFTCLAVSETIDVRVLRGSRVVPFALRVPPQGPLSFGGQIFKLEWFAQLVVSTSFFRSDATSEIGFKVEPGERTRPLFMAPPDRRGTMRSGHRSLKRAVVGLVPARASRGEHVDVRLDLASPADLVVSGELEAQERFDTGNENEPALETRFVVQPLTFARESPIRYAARIRVPIDAAASFRVDHGGACSVQWRVVVRTNRPTTATWIEELEVSPT